MMSILALEQAPGGALGQISGNCVVTILRVTSKLPAFVLKRGKTRLKYAVSAAPAIPSSILSFWHTVHLPLLIQTGGETKGLHFF